MSTLSDLLEHHLKTPGTSWSVGCFGGLAEFHWAADEVILSESPLSRATDRGALAIDPVAVERAAEATAWEAPGGHGRGWSQGLAIHASRDGARMGERRTMTRLDDETGGATFDIGIGAPNVDACVVTEDPELCDVLMRNLGRSLWEEGNHSLQAIKEASPLRVFRSRVAEIRVHQEIGSTTGRPTPNGPHTHVIRKMLRTVRPQDARLPVPAGRQVVLSMYPAHPLRDPMGKATPFDSKHWDTFQQLLGAYGPASYASSKREFIENARGEGTIPKAPDHRLARVLLVQLGQLGVCDERIAEHAQAWGLSHVLERSPTQVENAKQKAH